MKKLLFISLLFILLLTGCKFQKQDTETTTEKFTDEEVDTTESITSDTTEEGDSSILELLPDSFSFSSGVGAWSTDLHIEKDGTFSGVYHDSDMGDVGENYPNGTIYICKFSGKFSVPEQIDEYTYSMKLESIEQEGNPGEEYYEDDIRYVYSEPHGLVDADEIMIYLPGFRVADLPEEFLSWSGLAYNDDMPEDLPYYGLYNVNGEEGFVGYTE